MVNEGLIFKIVSEITGKDCKSIVLMARASYSHFEVVYFSLYSGVNLIGSYKWNNNIVSCFNERIKMIKPHLVSKCFGVNYDGLYRISVYSGNEYQNSHHYTCEI